MKPATGFEVTELSTGEYADAGALLGLAYRDNPLSFALYGDDPEPRAAVNTAIFPIRMKNAGRPPLAVRDGDRLIGVCGYDVPDRPDASPADMQTIMSTLASVGPDVPATLMALIAEWRTFAPKEPHWNLGPVGVASDMQRRGIANAMLRRFCDLADAEHALVFLETDIERNARLYERFGFVTTECTEIMGVRTWFMVRAAR